MPHETNNQPGTDPQHASRHDQAWYHVAGVALILGAILTTVFNLLFPRPEDPADTAGVLTTMADQEVRRQVSYLGVVLGIWAVTAGVGGIARTLNRSAAAVWSRLAFSGALLGATLFTASAGLGLATTEAAVDWVTAGADTTSPQYAVAAALHAADDSLWFMSIISLWGALGLLGISMLMGQRYPQWLGAPILGLGVANALLVGVPLAYGIDVRALHLLFAGLGELSLLWALVTGSWMVRRTR